MDEEWTKDQWVIVETDNNQSRKIHCCPAGVFIAQRICVWARTPAVIKYIVSTRLHHCSFFIRSHFGSV